jgi:cyclophilin family peptidyl-prolyl cis-trans isomerase
MAPPTPEPVAPTPVATPPVVATDDAPNQEQVVVLKTTFGNIVIELDNSAAPRTCENFRNLVSDGFYNRTVFHRVIPNFIIQGGDPLSKGPNRASYGLGGPGYKLRPEIKLTHDEGAVAMARLPDSVNPTRESNGSQFYICLTDCPSLDAKYTVFGHVIKGIDVAKKIGDAPRDAKDDPLTRIEMDASLESKSQAMANDSAN